MRKLIIVVVVISAIILAGVGLTQLKNFGEDLFTVTSHEYQSSQQVFNSVKFKSVNENESLLNAVFALNDSFIKNSPFKTNTEKQLNKSYQLFNFFPNNQLYHTAKRKIENTIFSELPNLYNKISGLSDSELTSFLEENKTYLDKNFGVTDVDTFQLLAFSLSGLKSANITDCYVVTDSIIYNSYDSSTLFNIVVTDETNKKILLGVTATLESSSPNQNSPEIQFNGTFGGVE